MQSLELELEPSDGSFDDGNAGVEQVGLLSKNRVAGFGGGGPRPQAGVDDSPSTLKGLAATTASLPFVRRRMIFSPRGSSGGSDGGLFEAVRRACLRVIGNFDKSKVLGLCAVAAMLFLTYFTPAVVTTPGPDDNDNAGYNVTTLEDDDVVTLTPTSPSTPTETDADFDGFR